MIKPPLSGDIEQRPEWKSERHIDQGSRSLAVPLMGYVTWGVGGEQVCLLGGPSWCVRRVGTQLFCFYIQERIPFHQHL